MMHFARTIRVSTLAGFLTGLHAGRARMEAVGVGEGKQLLVVAGMIVRHVPGRVLPIVLVRVSRWHHQEHAK